MRQDAGRAAQADPGAKTTHVKGGPHWPARRPGVRLSVRVGVAIVSAALFGVAAVFTVLAANAWLPGTRETVWGVTYSPRFAESLGLDPQTLYVDMLDDLGVRHVRFPVYWDDVEPRQGAYDFAALDWYLTEAQARNAEVVLVVGYKQPRWPECYAPGWTADLSDDALRAQILALVKEEVAFASRHPNVTMWQVENEPFRRFGECRPGILTSEFLAEELQLVSQLDARPTVMTDSGELSTWFPAMRLSREYFGTVVYRQIYFRGIGFWQHPLPPWLYSARNRLDRMLLRRAGETILIELQAEAWFQPAALADIPPAMQQRQFPATLLLSSNFEFGRRTGFPQIYLWGVEWWSWMEVQGYPEYVEHARTIFRPAAGQPLDAGRLRAGQ